MVVPVRGVVPMTRVVGKAWYCRESSVLTEHGTSAWYSQRACTLASPTPPGSYRCALSHRDRARQRDRERHTQRHTETQTHEKTWRLVTSHRVLSPLMASRRLTWPETRDQKAWAHAFRSWLLAERERAVSGRSLIRTSAAGGRGASSS
eukprot:1292810-Rhodomonas_salina.1